MEEGLSVIMAVSGGVDSCYLLHNLVSKKVRGVVAHVNHGLRPESVEEAAFVRDLAERYELPYEEKTLSGLPTSSFEAHAREARLRFFSEVGSKYDLDTVALAHHADDQAETLLMQLCRGTMHLSGMREYSAMEEYGGLRLWRPLLSKRKSEIRAWMQSQGLEWREDSTNGQPVAVRNRVRNEVVPLLNDIFSREVVPVINRAQSNEAELFSELIGQLNLRDPQGRLYVPKLEPLSQDLCRKVIFEYLKEQGVEGLSLSKLDECLSLLDPAEVAKVNLPGDQFLRRKEKRLFVE